MGYESMERETFLSGYCRCLDGARTVVLVTEGNTLLEVDCGYENCPHTPNCTVAQKIREILETK